MRLGCFDENFRSLAGVLAIICVSDLFCIAEVSRESTYPITLTFSQLPEASMPSQEYSLASV